MFALLFILANIFSFLISPILNALSRKNEFAADQHGAKVTSKEDMKNALIALARENKAFIKTSKIYAFFISVIQVLVIESRLFLDYKKCSYGS